MLVSISLNREMTGAQLQKLLNAKGDDRRVLMSRLISDDKRGAVYLYVTADEAGDYTVNQVHLGSRSLIERDYFVKADRVLETGLQSMWEAKTRMVKSRASLSGAKPIQAITFPLSVMGLQFHPNLEQIVYNWGKTQDIVPINYATYNPREDAIELSLQDPGARNSSVRMRIIEQGLFTELKKYLEAHPEIGEYDEDRLNQLVSPDSLELRPVPVQPDIPL